MRSFLLALLAMIALAAPISAEARHRAASVKHVFVIVLENENADVTFAPGSPAPYLSTRCRARARSFPSTTESRT